MDSFLKNFPDYILCYIRPNPNYDPTDKNSNPTIMKHNLSHEEALEYNQLRWKGDIYFTPNGNFKKNIFKEGFDIPLNKRSNKGRSANNAENIYAIVVDIDFGKDEIWKNYEGLDKPSYIIETYKGHHLYYILEKPVLYKDYKKEFTQMEERLVVMMKGDPKCTDSSRVLRVPGYKYWRDNKGEYEIQIKETNDIKYDFFKLSDIIDKYYLSAGRDVEEKKVLIKKFKRNKDLVKSFEDFFDVVQRLDVVDVLHDLFGNTYDVKGGGAIYENGKRTDGYKYCKRGNFLNTFSDNDRPTGGPYSVAKFYFKNTPATIDYFRERWNIDLRSFGEIKKSLSRETVELKPAIEGERGDYKTGDSMSGIIVKFKEEKIIQYSDGGKVENEYINGIVETYGTYRLNEQKRFIVKITKNKQSEIRTFPIIGGTSDLRKFLISAGLVVGNSDGGMIWLLKYLTSVTKEYAYITTLGLQMVNGKKIVVKKGGTYLDEDNLLFVDIPEITGEFIKVDEENDVELKDFLTDVFKGYGGSIIFPIFLAVAMGVNCFFWRNKKMDLPQLFLTGLSQTGKSVILKNMFNKAFGISLEMAAASKVFVYQKMAKHYMPIRFGEYRNATVQQAEVEGILRHLFDGTQQTKGKSDQSIVYYPSNAMYIIDGQATFSDDAALTRLYYLIANPRDKGEKKYVINMPNIMNRIIDTFQDENDFEKYIKLIYKYEKKIQSSITLTRENDRMIYCYACLYALSERYGLEEFNHYLDDALMRQNVYLAVDDIKNTYMRSFNLVQMYRFSSYLYKGGMIIDIIPEYLKTNNTADFAGMIKTVNHHFLGSDYAFVGMEVYVDFEYIYKNKDLWGSFIRTVEHLTFEGEHTEQEHNTIKSLQAFLEKNFPKSGILQNINYEIGVRKPIEVEKTLDY